MNQYACANDDCYRILALDSYRNGTTLWQSTILFGYPYSDWTLQGALYANDNDYIVAFDLKHGDIMFNASNDMYTGWVSIMSTSIYAGNDGLIMRASLDMGTPVWYMPVPCANCSLLVLGEDADMTYIVSENFDSNDEGLVAVSKATGTIEWSVVFSSFVLQSELFSGGAVYYLTSTNDATYMLTALYAPTGQTMWTYQFAVPEGMIACDLPDAPENGVLYIVCGSNMLALNVPAVVPPPPPPSNGGGGSNGGKIAGAVIGALLGVALLGAVVFFVNRRGGFRVVFASLTVKAHPSSASSKGSFATGSYSNISSTSAYGTAI
jgi:hypothetical protein